MNLLLNKTMDTEVQVTSNVPYVEVLAEQHTFETSVDNQAVRFDIQIPLTVHQTAGGAENGAFRIYLDGDAIGPNGKQWNGYLITNGGAWCDTPYVPTDGRIGCSLSYVIPTAGRHTLRIQYAGSKPYTIGTMRSRRTIQVVCL